MLCRTTFKGPTGRILESVSKPLIALKIVAQKRSTLRNMPDISGIDRFAKAVD
jgi:hypothetical protein